MIGILADLNGCDKSDIRLILGVEESKYNHKGGRQRLIFDTELAIECFHEGMTDKQIGEVVGISEQSIRNWRERNGFYKRRNGEKGVKKP